jgi:phosphoglycolate phosphatase-like HAD superfamily hydrolase
MIGDGSIDVEAGKLAGVLTCGVTYGLGEKADVIAAGPDYLIDDLSEVRRYVC